MPWPSKLPLTLTLALDLNRLRFCPKASVRHPISPCFFGLDVFQLNALFLQPNDFCGQFHSLFWLSLFGAHGLLTHPRNNSNDKLPWT